MILFFPLEKSRKQLYSPPLLNDNQNKLYILY